MPKATAGSTRCATAWSSSRRTRASAPRLCATYSKDDLDEWAAVIKKGSDEAYADAQFVLDAPHAQPIDQMRRTEAMEDPKEWAFTWRAYKKRILKQK